MPLGTEVGLGLGYIVIDGDPAPSERGTAAPTFWPMSFVANRSPILALLQMVAQKGSLRAIGRCQSVLSVMSVCDGVL